MIAKLYNDNEFVGNCEVDNDTSIIIYRSEYYVYNNEIYGYERAKAQRVSSIAYTPAAAVTQSPMDH